MEPGPGLEPGTLTDHYSRASTALQRARLTVTKHQNPTTHVTVTQEISQRIFALQKILGSLWNMIHMMIAVQAMDG